ncbi:MAG: hypothetical protein LBF08_05100 [Dysgonamonadaceae bacterium]|jgi:hypothetical protein|nr:hypothetical protein [Dysgonamonadaceae bacterium]
MYDTVDFWINRVGLSGASPFGTQQYLSNITERNNENGYSCNGNVGDYKINISDNGISLKGSLSKHYYGDNLHTLTRRDTQHAIEKLSEQLHLDVGKAKPTRLDVSTIVCTRRPAADYYRWLGAKPYFERVQTTTDTVYYINYQKRLCFYDKAKQAEAKNIPIPPILQNSNLLRYELRFTKRLNKQFNTDLTATKLYDKDFYRPVIQSWYDEFKSIKIINNKSFMTNDITTLKGAKAAIIAYSMQRLEQDVINEFLSVLRANNSLKSRSDYTRVKEYINKMRTASDFEDKSDLIKELQEKFFDIARYAR